MTMLKRLIKPFISILILSICFGNSQSEKEFLFNMINLSFDTKS